MALATVGEFLEELFHLVHSDLPVRLGLHRLAADDQGHGGGSDASEGVDCESSVWPPGIYGAEALTVLVGEVVEGAEELDELVVLGTVGIDHFGQGVVSEGVDELGGFEHLVEADGRELHAGIVEVRRDGLTAVGVITEEGFHPGGFADAEIEYLQAAVDQRAEGIGLTSSAGPFKKGFEANRRGRRWGDQGGNRGWSWGGNWNWNWLIHNEGLRWR